MLVEYFVPLENMAKTPWTCAERSLRKRPAKLEFQIDARVGNKSSSL